MRHKSVPAREIFIHAIENVPQEGWGEYLDSACGEDAALHRKVRRLLDAHAADGHFMDKPATAPLATLDETFGARIGTQIGPYKLREQLGEGGMGVVYVAEQTVPVKRKVALKIIKPGMASKDVVGRFEAERQALAMMDHPNIAKVHDGGATDSGLPYFVMELVQGLSITEYCDAHQLSIGPRLKLFATVCRAIQHAHQKGIIHRDLKPQNIIVAEIDDTAVPKVIDFGVAKAVGQTLTEDTLYTHFSQMVGTPLYMSPEQTGLGVVDVDTRSDIYSLGVVLYELLTGSTPFDRESLKNAGFDEMRRMIRQDDPMRPSALVSTLKADALSTATQQRGIDPRKFAGSLAGELDWIVMKALEKDRDRRYESASALAADVERYLAGESVEACPPSIIYRVRKYVFRRKALLATSAIVCASLVLGIIGTGWQAWRATSALETAERERANAQASFQRAKDAVDKLLVRFKEDELLQNPEMQTLRNELLAIAREYYDEFVKEHEGNQNLEPELAAAYQRLGDIAWISGNIEIGWDAHTHAIEILESRVKANPSDDDRRHDLAAMGLAVGRNPINDQQEFYLEKAIESATDLKDPAHRHTLGQALLKLSDVLQRRYRHNSGNEAHRDESLALANRAVEVLAELNQEFPKQADYEASLADAYNVLSANFQDRRDADQAREYEQRSLGIFRSLVEAHPDMVEYRWKLAYLLGDHGHGEESIAILKELVNDFPQVLKYQELLIDNYCYLGHEQLDAAKLGVNAATKLADRYPDNVEYRAKLGRCLVTLARAQEQAGEIDESMGSYTAAITALEAIKPYWEGYLSDAYRSLAEIAEARGDLSAAMIALQKSREVQRHIREVNPDNLRFLGVEIGSRVTLASLLRQAGNLEEAIAECRACEALLREEVPNDRQLNAPLSAVFVLLLSERDLQSELGTCLQQVGKPSEAASAFRQAIQTEHQIVREVPQSLVHESPNPLYDSYVAACHKSDRAGEIEPMLRNELTTWRELEQHSNFKDTCQLRQLEIQLRLAEHLLTSNQPQLAAEQYRDARLLLEALIAQHQIKSKTIRTCLQVTSTPRGVDSPNCEERSQLLEMLQPHLDHEEASSDNAEDE